MNSPLDQSVTELLRQSAVGPMLDRPVNDVLADMGFGPLPEIPAIDLSGMPPLPAIDLSLLAKPLTDLASTFGTGLLPGAAVPASDGQVAEAPFAAATQDPAQVLAQVSSVVQTAMQLGSSALQAVMALWQGMGAEGAAEKAVQAQKDGTEIAAQSAKTSSGVVTAAGSVFVGASQMAAIIAKFMTSLAAAGPFLATPGGQIFLVAMTSETLGEATVVVAETRTELGIESADMVTTGQKVSVTNAPTGVDPTQMLSQLMQTFPSLASAAMSTAQSVAQGRSALDPAKSLTDISGAINNQGSVVGGWGGAPGFGGVGSAGIGGMGTGSVQPRPLSPWVGTRSAGGFGSAGVSAPPSGTGGTLSPGAVARGGSAVPGSGMVPMGAGAAGLARGGEATDGLRGQLVTGQHGNEVIGDIEGASLPVVGAAERVSEPADLEPPDKALTL